MRVVVKSIANADSVLCAFVTPKARTMVRERTCAGMRDIAHAACSSFMHATDTVVCCHCRCFLLFSFFPFSFFPFVSFLFFLFPGCSTGGNVSTEGVCAAYETKRTSTAPCGHCWPEITVSTVREGGREGETIVRHGNRCRADRSTQQALVGSRRVYGTCEWRSRKISYGRYPQCTRSTYMQLNHSP